MLFASLNAYTMVNGGIYTKLQSGNPTKKLHSLLVTMLHNHNCEYLLAAVNNLTTVLISGVGQQ